MITARHDGHKWTAVRDDWDLDDPVGHGPTEFAAVKDLIEQWMCDEPHCDDAETTRFYRASGSAVRLCLCEAHKPYWARRITT